MSEHDASLALARAAVDDVIRTASVVSATWTTPRAPGKWSPSLVVEHVALSWESGADEIAGRPSRFPTLPRPLRFLARGLLFNRVLRTKTFPKAKTNRAMTPTSGPATPAEAAARLDAAWGAFVAAYTDAAARGDDMTSVMFGRVRLVDYLRFQEYHTRHHHAQMTWS
jgi:hypothetical protein